MFEHHLSRRQMSVDVAEKWRGYRSKVPLVAMNWAAASARMILAAMAKWRVAGADPSDFLRTAVADARQLVEPWGRLPSFHDRLAFGQALADAAYAQCLLGEPPDPAFDVARREVAADRVQLARVKAGWVVRLDLLLSQQLRGERAPEAWDGLVADVQERKRSKALLASFVAYRALLDAAPAGDSAGAARAIATGGAAFDRRPAGLGVTWGGPDAAGNARMVDLRLACAIRKAEEIRPGLTSGVETPHRWNWG